MKREESALLVPVPDAERAVGEWRSLYDPSASAGVPAHVTLLYPFVPRTDIDAALVKELHGHFAATRAFPFKLRRVGRFPGILYLEPDPDHPFRKLTEALLRRYPDFPPYGGVYEEVIPHLTVIDRSRERPDVALLRRAEADVLPHLPVATRADRVWLMVQRRRRWQLHTSFVLDG